MSVLKKAIGAAGGLALLALPVVAQAAPAASRLSLNAAPQVKSGARIGADRKDESKATSGVVLGVLAAAAVGVGIAVAVDGGNDHNEPVSN